MLKELWNAGPQYYIVLAVVATTWPSGHFPLVSVRHALVVHRRDPSTRLVAPIVVHSSIENKWFLEDYHYVGQDFDLFDALLPFVS